MNGEVAPKVAPNPKENPKEDHGSVVRHHHHQAPKRGKDPNHGRLIIQLARDPPDQLSLIPPDQKRLLPPDQLIHHLAREQLKSLRPKDPHRKSPRAAVDVSTFLVTVSQFSHHSSPFSLFLSLIATLPFFLQWILRPRW